MELYDKVVVVTGAARGIGAALVRRFALERPRAIVVSDVDAASAEVVVRDISALEVPVLAFSADVTSRSDIDRLVETAESEFGGIDLLCSNAGAATGMGLHATDAVWEHAWRLNVLSHVRLAQRVLPGMSRRRSGHIVITASAAGLLGLPGDAPYAATKSAAIAFAEWLAVTYEPVGVRVSALCPLGVRTEFLMPGLRAGHPAARAVADSGEILEPDAVAEAVVDGLAREVFFIFPHEKVAALHATKAADPDAWLRRRRVPRP